jgi:hypothetical protein
MKGILGAVDFPQHNCKASVASLGKYQATEPPLQGTISSVMRLIPVSFVQVKALVTCNAYKCSPWGFLVGAMLGQMTASTSKTGTISHALLSIA